MTEGLTEAAVWECGDRNVAQPPARRVLARGDFAVAAVRGIQDDRWGSLDVDFNNDPVGHANVVGWPPITETEARNNMAKRLRATATPVPRPQTA